MSEQSELGQVALLCERYKSLKGVGQKQLCHIWMEKNKRNFESVERGWRYFMLFCFFVI